MPARPDRRHRGPRVPLPHPLPAWWPLRPQETRVAELLAADYTHQQIATFLGCGHLTVQTHTRAISRALRDVPVPAEQIPPHGFPTTKSRVLALVTSCGAYAAAHPGRPLPVALLRGEQEIAA